MDPVSSFDSYKYVYQDPNVWIVNQSAQPSRPFKLKPAEKSEKTKKDLKKNNQRMRPPFFRNPGDPK